MLRERFLFVPISAFLSLPSASTDKVVQVDLLIPLSFNGGGIDTLNAQIPSWAASKNTTDSPINIADCSTKAGFTTSMLRDGVHPNDQGDQLIAKQVGPQLIQYVKGLIAERGL